MKATKKSTHLSTVVALHCWICIHMFLSRPTRENLLNWLSPQLADERYSFNLYLIRKFLSYQRNEAKNAEKLLVNNKVSRIHMITVI